MSCVLESDEQRIAGAVSGLTWGEGSISWRDFFEAAMSEDAGWVDGSEG